MRGFLSGLFAAQEKVKVAAENAAPVVVDDEDDEDDWSSESVAGIEALARVQLLEREHRAMAERLATVERRLIEVGATVEEWRGE